MKAWFVVGFLMFFTPSGCSSPTETAPTEAEPAPAPTIPKRDPKNDDDMPSPTPNPPSKNPAE